MVELQELQKARYPEKGEATAFGVFYCRELDTWVRYCMPDELVLGGDGNKGPLLEFDELMLKTGRWAESCTIKAEAARFKRYCK